MTTPRTRIKICGLTRLEDVQLATRLGADAVGFVFAGGPRQVTPKQARELAMAVPAWVTRVGVFAASQKNDAPAIAEACRLDTLQLHGARVEDAAFAAYHRGRFTMVLGLSVAPDDTMPLADRLAAVAPHVDAVLLDTAVGGQSGGTGQAFDWSLLTGLPEVPIIVAGGLNADTVGELLARYRPWGVDTSSGVESAPGLKDPERMAAFFEAVRKA